MEVSPLSREMMLMGSGLRCVSDGGCIGRVHRYSARHVLRLTIAIGFPSVGKSTLMSELTGTHSEVAAYECTFF